MATRPVRPVRSLVRTAVVSLALVGGSLAVTPPAVALLPCGTSLNPCQPDTVITGLAPTPNSGKWIRHRTVTVTFEHRYDGTEPDGQTTFECRAPATEWTACTSPASFSGLPDTDRTDPESVHRIDVRAVHPDGETRDQTAATRSFRLDATAPDTYLLGAPTLAGPRENLLLDNTATFQYATLNHTDESGGDPVFRCTFDGRALPCPETRGTNNGSRTLTGITAGDHRFTVAAVDQAGNLSRPEAFAFHTPYNRVGRPRQIRRMWTRVAAPGHYLDDYVTTRERGSVLSRRFRNFNEAYLIVAKGPGHGRIRVDIGSTRVKTARLSARKFKHTRVIKLTIPGGGRRISGRIKVTVISPSGRPVMVDAVAVR